MPHQQPTEKLSFKRFVAHMFALIVISILIQQLVQITKNDSHIFIVALQLAFDMINILSHRSVFLNHISQLCEYAHDLNIDINGPAAL